MVRLEHNKLLAQAVFALAQRIDTSPHRRYPLADVQVEPFNKGGVHLPTTRSQCLLDGLKRPKHDAMLDVDKAPAAVRLDHLSVKKLGQGHQARFGPRPCVLAPLWLHPITKLGEQSGPILLG